MRTVALAALLLAPCLTAALTHPVPTESGLLKGAPSTDKSITAFTGVPFAAPPIGQNRWRAPQPPPTWHGVRAADHFGPNCIQTIVDGKHPWTHEFMAHGNVSGDCLFLNIWTPAAKTAEKHPVFVYLHGGANTEGSGSIDVYNGEGLAKKGLVMITVNYRLGVFGFFTHPELSREAAYHASGNYALLDQIAALQWIARNIAAFGGDPTRVTVAGQSAGASDIQLLLVSPLAKGLFQRAIMESGGAPAPPAARPLSIAEADGIKFAEAKKAPSLADLRALPWADIFAPVQGLRFGPVADDYVVPARNTTYAPIPILTGSNADENGASPHPTVTADQFTAQAHQRYGDRATDFLKLYPASDNPQAADRSNQSARDRRRVACTQWAATLKSPVYLYFYDHALPGQDAERYGAFHTSEVPYVLNTLSKSDRPFTAEDRRIADTLSSYWANFAANGDPNAKGLPHWPAAAESPQTVMEIGDTTRALPAADEARYRFFRELAAQP